MDTVMNSPIGIKTLETTGTKSLGYEYNRVVPFLLRPLMRLMVWQTRKRAGRKVAGSANHLLFDGLGKLCRSIREGAASWKALDIIYNFHRGGLIDSVWIRYMENAQAVRNRRKIIVSEVHRICREYARRKESVRILSLASGSAQAVFEGLGSVESKILLIDFDKQAGTYASQMASKYRFAGEMTFRRGNLLQFEKMTVAKEFQPDLVEMAGLLDYLTDSEAVALITHIFSLLPVGGSFITCHIHDNSEREFMTEVIEWGRDDGRQRPMLYRSPAELVMLIRSAGFEYITVRTEPHGIHSVAIAEKR